MEYIGTALRITASTTIKARHFLGAKCVAGTLTVDRGSSLDPNKRIVTLAAGADIMPSFPITTDPEGQIRCEGATDATIYYSV